MPQDWRKHETQGYDGSVKAVKKLYSWRKQNPYILCAYSRCLLLQNDQQLSRSLSAHVNVGVRAQSRAAGLKVSTGCTNIVSWPDLLKQLHDIEHSA